MSASGWYPNPDDPTMIRYWDGQSWVGEPQPAPNAAPPPPPAPGSDPPTPVVPPTPAGWAPTPPPTQPGAFTVPNVPTQPADRPVPTAASPKSSSSAAPLVIVAVVVLVALVGAAYWFVLRDDSTTGSPEQAVIDLYHGIAEGDTSLCLDLGPAAQIQMARLASVPSCSEAVKAVNDQFNAKEKEDLLGVEVTKVVKVSDDRAHVPDSSVVVGGESFEDDDPNPAPIVVELMDGRWVITDLG